MDVRYAKIEDVNDPRGFNRLKVRIDGYHSETTPLVMLPWAQVLSRGGGMPDSGSADKYIKGASVLVVLERDDLSRPWVLGGIPKETEAHTSTLGTSPGDSEIVSDRVTAVVPSFQKYGDGLWAPESGSVNDLPQEANDNAVTCVFKTNKGAALYVDETDEQEKLILVDRAGQCVELVSPVTAAENAGSTTRTQPPSVDDWWLNAQRRGTGLASAGTALEYSVMAGPAYIKATDLGGNTVLLYSEDGEEKIEIDNDAHGNSLVFDKDGFVLEVLGGQAGGGLTIAGGSSGLTVNGQYLATESFVEWLNTKKDGVVQSTKPGTQAPLFPTALADFVSKESASVNSSGMRTRL